MAMIKNDGYGVYRVDELWWFKTYRDRDPPMGPYKTREQAMEHLLACLGFDVAPSISSTEGK